MGSLPTSMILRRSLCNASPASYFHKSSVVSMSLTEIIIFTATLGLSSTLFDFVPRKYVSACVDCLLFSPR